jgi:hypothetical protein
LIKIRSLTKFLKISFFFLILIFFLNSCQNKKNNLVKRFCYYENSNQSNLICSDKFFRLVDSKGNTIYNKCAHFSYTINNKKVTGTKCQENERWIVFN